MRTALAFCALALCSSVASAADEDWIQLFNGRDLTGWTPKITHHELGDNFAKTFRVEDGLLKVRYDGYKDGFQTRFGHLFYAKPYSYYRLRVEYRFVGKQVGEGQRWAERNSGIMFHSQAPQTMTKEQDFPISIEAQFLGGLSDGKPRPTLSMCSPGTEIVYNGELYPKHCLESASKTYDGDQWVQIELIVIGGAHITHLVDGQKVLEYSLPQIGGGVVTNFDPKVKRDGELVSGGYIALQSESHPLDVRKIELLDLEGCMDGKAKNYRKYFVHSVPKTCTY